MSLLQAHLTACGMNPIQAEIWENFIHAVVSSIRRAEQRLTAPDAWAEYCERKGAFRKAKTRKGVALPRMPHEEGLTDALKHLLQDLRRESREGSSLRKLDIHFEGEAKVKSKRVIGKSARKTDIRAASYLSGFAPDLAFEAKVVDSCRDILTGYLGSQGLGCFTEPPDPYTRGPMGGLLAYTVCDAEPKWVARIQTAFSTATQQELVNLGAPPAPVLASEVERPKLGLPSILMLSLVLRFETDPPRLG